MEFSKTIKALQIIAGVVGIIIGTGMAFIPIAFQSSAGIVLGDDLSLLSETRAPGSVLLIGGIVILLSVFKREWRRIGLVLTALLYLGYGFGRTISLAFDGIPHQSLLIALILELVLGGLALLVLWRSNKVAIS